MTTQDKLISRKLTLIELARSISNQKSHRFTHSCSYRYLNHGLTFIVVVSVTDTLTI